MARLKILRVTTDKSVYMEGSPASQRVLKQAELVEEMHVLVLGSSAADKQLGKNVWIHGAPAPSGLSNSAASKGKKIVAERSFVRGESVIVAVGVFACGEVGVAIKNAWRLPLEVEVNDNLARLGFWEERKVRKVLKSADALSTAGSGVARLLAEKYGVDPKSILVALPHIDAKKIELSRATFDIHAQYGWGLVLLSAALHDPRDKNFGMAIDVLARLRTYFPEAGLVVLGAGKDAAKLEDYARKLGVLAHVAFAPYADDWASYYRTADIFIQTSDFESYGEELVTAGLMGLPIVTTRVGVANLFENGVDALVCPPGDAEYMFRALYNLLKDDSLRVSMRVKVSSKAESIAATGEQDTTKMVENWERVAKKVSTANA